VAYRKEKDVLLVIIKLILLIFAVLTGFFLAKLGVQTFGLLLALAVIGALSYTVISFFEQKFGPPEY